MDVHSPKNGINRYWSIAISPSFPPMVPRPYLRFSPGGRRMQGHESGSPSSWRIPCKYLWSNEMYKTLYSIYTYLTHNIYIYCMIMIIILYLYILYKYYCDYCILYINRCVCICADLICTVIHVYNIVYTCRYAHFTPKPSTEKVLRLPAHHLPTHASPCWCPRLKTPLGW